MQCFGRVWHFWWGACSVLKGRGTLEEEVLAVYWRGVAFLEGCDILEEALAVFWRDVAFLEGCLCNVLEGRGILEGCL